MITYSIVTLDPRTNSILRATVSTLNLNPGWPKMAATFIFADRRYAAVEALPSGNLVCLTTPLVTGAATITEIEDDEEIFTFKSDRSPVTFQEVQALKALNRWELGLD